MTRHGDQGCPADAAPDTAAAPGDPRLDPLEVELLRLLGQGLVVGAVAHCLGLSERTVRRRARAVCDRLGVQTPIEAVVWATRHGLI
jgi:DNA-binding NarL/FixJ family response regulator